MNDRAVFGVVGSEAIAESVVVGLTSAGILPRDISVLFPNGAMTRDFAHTQGTKAPEGALAGGTAGGALGGAFGLLAGLGVLVIPGIGPLFAAGPIFAALSAAAVGAAVGGVAGGLVGLGIPEIHATRYVGLVREGHVLVSVHTTENELLTIAKGILETHGATDIALATGSTRSPTRGAPTAPTGTTPV